MNNIKVREFSGELYRADSKTSVNGINAANNYRNAPMKYFTLIKSETNTYTRYGKPHVKTWVVSPERPLILIDIMNRQTRNSIRDAIGEEALNIEFPVNNNGAVYRVSEENTKSMNDKALGSICDLGKYDGYIMNSQEARNGVGSFHSEVGLCKHAFDKLKLVESVRAAPPRVERPILKRKINRGFGSRVSTFRIPSVARIENYNINNINIPAPRRLKLNNTRRNNGRT